MLYNSLSYNTSCPSECPTPKLYDKYYVKMRGADADLDFNLRRNRDQVDSSLESQLMICRPHRQHQVRPKKERFQSYHHCLCQNHLLPIVSTVPASSLQREVVHAQGVQLSCLGFLCHFDRVVPERVIALTEDLTGWFEVTGGVRTNPKKRHVFLGNICKSDPFIH